MQRELASIKVGTRKEARQHTGKEEREFACLHFGAVSHYASLYLCETTQFARRDKTPFAFRPDTTQDAVSQLFAPSSTYRLTISLRKAAAGRHHPSIQPDVEAKGMSGKRYVVIREQTTLCGTTQITFLRKQDKEWEEAKQEEMEGKLSSFEKKQHPLS